MPRWRKVKIVAPSRYSRSLASGSEAAKSSKVAASTAMSSIMPSDTDSSTQRARSGGGGSGGEVVRRHRQDRYVVGDVDRVARDVRSAGALHQPACEVTV